VVRVGSGQSDLLTMERFERLLDLRLKLLQGPET
jgi:hypothetical protein